jgi:prepilin-type N-terminal cleavage/methylation domain-containing protein
MKKGFTITELLVAVGLLAVVFAACGVIFNYSIDAMRTASATSEIMRNLRAITDQLDADFAGLQKSNAKMFVDFSSGSPFTDSIVFFATGDFQTYDAYGTNDETVRSNIARIYYGQAATPSPTSQVEKDRRSKILARKQVILAPSKTTATNEYDPNSFFKEAKKSFSEDTNSCSWLIRPDVDPNKETEIPMYLARGVDEFSIMVDDGIDPNHSIEWWPQPADRPTKFENRPRVYPDLIKFTFTLYDSKGIIKNGRRFEYIVYIGK